MANNDLPEVNYRAVLENLQAGVLLFDAANKLVFANRIADEILGPNLMLVRSEGWSAFAMLIDASTNAKIDQPGAQQVLTRAQRQSDPVRFHMLLGGQYAPCWISSVNKQGDQRAAIVVMIEQIGRASCRERV
jgi:PAS domain-containing protein